MLSATIYNPSFQVFSLYESYAILLTSLLSLVFVIKKHYIASVFIAFFGMLYFMIEMVIGIVTFVVHRNLTILTTPSNAYVINTSLSLLLLISTGIVYIKHFMQMHLVEIDDNR